MKTIETVVGFIIAMLVVVAIFTAILMCIVYLIVLIGQKIFGLRRDKGTHRKQRRTLREVIEFGFNRWIGRTRNARQEEAVGTTHVAPAATQDRTMDGKPRA